MNVVHIYKLVIHIYHVATFHVTYNMYRNNENTWKRPSDGVLSTQSLLGREGGLHHGGRYHREAVVHMNRDSYCCILSIFDLHCKSRESGLESAAQVT